MTRYTVIWRKSTVEQLASIWMSATDRDAVEKAANAIDVELAKDASQKGTPRGRDLRHFSAYPLEVLFAVLEADRQVHVVAVRRLNVERNGPPSASGPIP